MSAKAAYLRAELESYHDHDRQIPNFGVMLGLNIPRSLR
ncbi:hypothetical protein AmaxDRAFT_0129 [Limnospira maxima CS-328]|uniref:Uncharacterized protein n=1 Tax=Limnospira maxima CS-328 TaxID=513049 RepID=B5VU88_LIMMA|nr:hypothetical protein AmaxDRAFT_0129 [Limnospira maxima CS-328]